MFELWFWEFDITNLEWLFGLQSRYHQTFVSFPGRTATSSGCATSEISWSGRNSVFEIDHRYSLAAE